MALDEIAQFAQHLGEQLGVKWMLTGMTTADVVTLRAKMLGKCGLHWRDDVTELAVSFEGSLFRKNRANRDELKGAALRIEVAISNMTKQHIRTRVWPHIKMLSESAEWGCRKLRRAISGATHVQKKIGPARHPPNIEPESAL